MKTYNRELEIIANDILYQSTSGNGAKKPNYSNRDFMNTLLIFQTALMDKMYNVQDNDKMSLENRSEMATKCGMDLRKLIHTYTGLDTHKVDSQKDFL
jgi:hypothetical protein|tara:strand:- start:924 stop:1217 length:294 start_codon:yes stop_codon:yes gene_type:complete